MAKIVSWNRDSVVGDLHQPDAEPELVQKVKDRFPDAKVVEVRDLPRADGSTGSGDGGQGSSIGLVDDELGDDTSRSA